MLETIKALKAIVQEGLRQRSYSEIASRCGEASNTSAVFSISTISSTMASSTRSSSAGSTQGRQDKPQLQDERAVSQGHRRANNHMSAAWRGR